MNIFVLDLDPQKCAWYHCDKHVVKMIVETAQLLSTAHHINGNNIGDFIYKKTHVNHPCAIWARESKENYVWLSKLGFWLCMEYRRRYGKIHKTELLIKKLRVFRPRLFEEDEMTKRPQCMPDMYKCENIVVAYRSYYISEKQSILKYTNRDKPNFLICE